MNRSSPIASLSLAQAKVALTESLSELKNHHVSCYPNRQPPPLLAELRTAIEPDRLHCQLFWCGANSPMGESFLWDAFDVAITAREQAEAAQVVLGEQLPLADGYLSEKVRRRAQHIPLFKYHPLRYRALMPFGKQLAQLGFDAAHTVFESRYMQESQRIYVAAQQNILEHPLRPRIAASNTRQFTTQPIELAVFFAEFNRAGRQIYALPNTLVDLFAQTNVDDLPFEAVKLPYEAFYLHFGRRDDLETAPGWYADGAYVCTLDTTEGKVVQLCLTSVPYDAKTYELFLAHPEPIYVHAMSEKMCKVGIGYAADAAFAEKKNELIEQQHRASTVDPEVIERLRNELDAPDFNVKDTAARNAKAELEMLPQKYQAYLKALRLIMNGIVYMTAYPEDIDTQWPENTPTDILNRYRDGSPKQRQRAKSQLASLGFTEIRTCGRHLRTNSSRYVADDQPTHAGHTWVEGHWKRQPYGPKHQLRRWQWRMPHRRIVNSRTPDEELGHFYIVK